MSMPSASGRLKRLPLSEPGFSIRIRRAARRGAEARWRFRPAYGGGSFHTLPHPCGEFYRFPVSSQPSVMQKSPQSHKLTSPFPSQCLSARPPPPAPATFRTGSSTHAACPVEGMRPFSITCSGAMSQYDQERRREGRQGKTNGLPSLFWVLVQTLRTILLV